MRHIATELQSPRLTIEPIERRHAALLHGSLQEPRIYTWISSTPPASIETLEARWSRANPHFSTDREEYFIDWAVKRSSDGVWIGKLDADLHLSGIATNVGYIFFPDFWGQGYAKEAVNALAAHLAANGIHEQRAAVTAGNSASCRVLESAGFKYVRTLPANDVIRGEPVDDLEYIRTDQP